MRLRLKRPGFLLCLGLLCPPAVGQELDTGQPPSRQDSDVLIERIRNKDGVYGLRGTIVVKAPPEAIWALLIDHERFAGIFPNVKKVRTKSRDDKGAVVAYDIESAWTSYSYVSRRDYLEPGRRLAWRKVEGDYGSMSGEWIIANGPDKEHRRIICTSFVDLWTLAPTALVREFAIGDMRSALRRLRESLESAAK